MIHVGIELNLQKRRTLMDHKICKILTGAVALSSVIAFENLEASNIKVVNQNTLPLVMEIAPELDSQEVVLCRKDDIFPLTVLPTVLPGCESNDAPVCQTNIASICNRLQSNTAEFIISPEHLHGHQHFSVTGNSGGIFSGGSCRNLSTAKNYQITFLNDDIGTTCISEEIEPALFSSVFLSLN